jgi:hypothetical protein
MGEKSVHGERKQPSERELASVEEAAVAIYGVPIWRLANDDIKPRV